MVIEPHNIRSEKSVCVCVCVYLPLNIIHTYTSENSPISAIIMGQKQFQVPCRQQLKCIYIYIYIYIDR